MQHGHGVAVRSGGVRVDRQRYVEITNRRGLRWRRGIGARIRVVTSAGSQYNHMTSSVGYASSSYGPVHFGLGAESVAKLVEIHWPSGIVQTLRDVAGDRVLKVKESDVK